MKLRYVSRRLRSVDETPSLWRELVWPWHHTGDVNNVLKVCGQHVKRLFFPNHMTFSKLMKILEYCSNVMELSLPTTMLDPVQLKKILLHMKHLQKLDIQWGDDTELRELFGMDLKELTIRTDEKSPSGSYQQTGPWEPIEDWMIKKFVPQKLNVITLHCDMYSSEF